MLDKGVYLCDFAQKANRSYSLYGSQYIAAWWSGGCPSAKLILQRTNLFAKRGLSEDRNEKIMIIEEWYSAPSDLQPHYGNGVFGNVYLLAYEVTGKHWWRPIAVMWVDYWIVASLIMPKNYMFWRSIWNYLKSQIQF